MASMSREQWIDRFVLQLSIINPAVDPDEGWRLGDELWETSSAMDPAVAAQDLFDAWLKEFNEALSRL